MPRYSPRPRHPQPIQLRDRDRQMLETMYAFDSLMSRRQLAALFFDGKDSSTCRTRLRQLYDNGYINQPDENNAHRTPLGEWPYWLDKKGYQEVAALRGENPDRQDLKRASQPVGYPKMRHHLVVGDVRVMVMQATGAGEWELVRWVSERQFNRWKNSDKLTYRSPTRGKTTRAYVPDGFFMLTRPYPGEPGYVQDFAFFLEVDLASEQHERLEEEKFLPARAYVGGRICKQRLGVKFGRVLMITQSEGRMHNMRRRAEALGVSSVFYFTTLDRLSTETILTEPVWLMADRDEPFGLTAPLE